MAVDNGKLISELPSNTSLDGTELFEIEKGTGVGSSQKATLASLAGKIGGLVSSLFASAAQGDIALTAIQNVVAGDGVSVDNTTPTAPIISATSDINSINDQTVVSYGLLSSDSRKLIRVTYPTACGIVIPKNSVEPLPLLTPILCFQGGAGPVSISKGDASMTLEAPNGTTTTAVGDFRAIIQLSVDVWVIG